MYSERFLRLTRQLLQFEGGYVNNPRDPGGATNYGITQRTYDNYRQLRNLPVNPVKVISHDEVLDIYYKNYYLTVGIDSLLSDPTGYILYDLAVNSGPAKALEYKQDTLDPVKLLDKRLQFYRTLCKRRPALFEFLNGWENRLKEIAQIYKLNWNPID